MSDVRSISQFALINDSSTNDVILSKLVNGRIETMHKVDVKTDYSEFPTADMPPMPPVGEWVEANTMYTDGTNNWNCIQSHNRTADAPINIPALFRQYRAQGQPWVQPIDQYDAYYLNDWVSFTDGKYYKNNLDGTPNVWAPNVTPQYWDECNEDGGDYYTMTWLTALKWNCKFWFIVCLSGCIMVVNIKESPTIIEKTKANKQDLGLFNKELEAEKDTIKK